MRAAPRLARLAAVLIALASAAAAADDDDAGYYFPAVSSSEVFERTLIAAPPAGRGVRIGFVTQVMRQAIDRAYAPRFSMFAKGAEAEDMIVVALDDEIFATLHRAWAVMAQLSAPARTTQFFVDNKVADVATFYDMLKIMGFRTLTLSDGKTWSHRVEFR
jgi:hypothetical protein